MRIAVDYDETFTEDKELFTLFIYTAKQRGHEVKFVTYRSSFCDNEDIKLDANVLGIDILFTNGRQKQHIYPADIWIDDNPVTIPNFNDLGNMYDGCLVNGDTNV